MSPVEFEGVAVLVKDGAPYTIGTINSALTYGSGIIPSGRVGKK